MKIKEVVFASTMISIYSMHSGEYIESKCNMKPYYCKKTVPVIKNDQTLRERLSPQR